MDGEGEDEDESQAQGEEQVQGLLPQLPEDDVAQGEGLAHVVWQLRRSD
jgi:hypothetical protein